MIQPNPVTSELRAVCDRISSEILQTVEQAANNNIVIVERHLFVLKSLEAIIDELRNLADAFDRLLAA